MRFGITQLDHLIKYSSDGFGDWSDMLGDGFSNGLFDSDDPGYMLLVGETEIIPAGCDPNRMEKVRTTDWFYESLDYDLYDEPELIVGRIIGNSPESLMKPIQYSLREYYGYAQPLSYKPIVYSGWTYSPAGGEDPINFADIAFTAKNRFKDNGFDAYWVHCGEKWGSIFSRLFDDFGTTLFAVMSSMIIVEKIRAYKNNVDYTSNDPYEIISLMKNYDIILLCGHGNYNHCDIFDTSVVASADWYTTHPVVIAHSCLTGRYCQGLSLAEAFLNNGAAVYIGHTESGVVGGLADFFEHAGYWIDDFLPLTHRIDVGEPFGDILYRQKHSALSRFDWGNNECGIYWCELTHLFGDPKYGASHP